MKLMALIMVQAEVANTPRKREYSMVERGNVDTAFSISFLWH